MRTLTLVIGSVIVCTLMSGLAGGLAGMALGTAAPTFIQFVGGEVLGSAARPGGSIEPVEFALGIGAVAGLLMGAAASTFCVFVLAVRDVFRAIFGGMGAREGQGSVPGEVPGRASAARVVGSKPRPEPDLARDIV